MIVVTGGAGFIGSALVWGLNLRGVDDVLIVDNLDESPKWKNLRGLRFADYLDKDDFLTRVQAGRFPAAVSSVIHMGACSDTTETDTNYLMANNFAYTRALAEASVHHGARFIYASSAATYGDGSHGYSDDHAKIETLRPLNMYGYSKQLFDFWALRTGLLARIAGLKFSNVFGPNEYHKARMRSVVVQAFEQIQTTGAVRLFKSYNPNYGDGQQMRDFVYIKDIVAMVLFLVDHPNVNGIFNAGSGRARTWNDLAAAAFAALDRPCKIEYIDMPLDLRGQYQYFTELPMEKLRQAGYTRPLTPLEDAVADYLRHYLIPTAFLDALEPGQIPLA
jgi:ADP-L-glycero-D-manno-heptose 6-epimerase